MLECLLNFEKKCLLREKSVVRSEMYRTIPVKKEDTTMYNEKMLDSFSKEYAERCQVTDKITAELFDANGYP